MRGRCFGISFWQRRVRYGRASATVLGQDRSPSSVVASKLTMTEQARLNLDAGCWLELLFGGYYSLAVPALGL